MIELLITYGAITLANLFSMAIKEDKALREAIKMFNEHGYEVNKNYSTTIKKFYKNDAESLNKDEERYFSFLPLTNIYYLFLNIKFFCGNHTHQCYYDDLSCWDNWIKDENKGLDELIADGVIKKIDKVDKINPEDEVIEEIYDEEDKSLYLNEYTPSNNKSTLKDLYRIKRILNSLERNVDKRIEQINKIENNKVKRLK